MSDDVNNDRDEETIRRFRMTDHRWRKDMSHTLYCKTQLSMNGQPAISCTPITLEQALYLNASGLVLKEDADVVLSLNGYEELEISSLTEQDVCLERLGRSYHLRANHPVRICENDIIHIADTSIRIVESTFVKNVPSASYHHSKFRLGLVSAAACTLAMLCACQSSKEPVVQEPAPAPAVQDPAPAPAVQDPAPAPEEKCPGQAPAVQEPAPAPAAAQDGCENYTQKCINDAPHICRDHTWKQITDCKHFGDRRFGCVEKSNTEAICTVVRTAGEQMYDCGEDGELKCQNGDVVVCKQHEWTESKKCQNDTVCAIVDGKADCVKKSTACSDGQCNIPAGKESGICSSGQRMCLNNNVYACTNGIWRLQEACFAPSHCEQSDGEFKCKNAEPCTDGEYACDDKDRYLCKDKRWVLSDSCQDGYACVKSSNTAIQCVRTLTGAVVPRDAGNECNGRETKCDSQTGIVSCENGFWRFSGICGPNYPICKAEDNHANCVKVSPTD